MATIKVGVLRGGPSEEHEVSLKTGKAVLENLSRGKYSGCDVLITKKGEWIFNHCFSSPERIFRSVDVVFNGLHGSFGEDGQVQRILEKFKIPYTGSDSHASFLGMNKILSREIFASVGLGVPKAVVVDVSGGMDGVTESAKEFFALLSPPWVVKPASSGSSCGISIVRHFKDLPAAIEAAAVYGKKILVEEFLKGREVTCAVVDGLRDRECYSMPIVEIVLPSNKEFFDYEAKYGGGTSEICPANLPLELKKKIEIAAIAAHKALGCRHYSRVDFIVSPGGKNKKEKISVLEVNTLPGLTDQSLLPKSAEAVGIKKGELLDHIITLALLGK